MNFTNLHWPPLTYLPKKIRSAFLKSNHFPTVSSNNLACAAEENHKDLIWENELNHLEKYSEHQIVLYVCIKSFYYVLL